MPDYPQLQQQFADDLTRCVTALPYPQACTADTPNDLQATVNSLINALPYFGNMAMESIHRGGLANLLEINLPNDAIKPHPDGTSPFYVCSYDYSGSYSGYRAAFYPGVGQSALAGDIQSRVQAANGGINPGWWSGFGVAILTDAIRQKVPVGLDTGKLSGDIASYNTSFRTGLTASYVSTLTLGFTPTATIFRQIGGDNLSSQAATLLDQAIAAQQFTANINQAISMGGDSTNAAVWFLYNLWVTLKGLGYADVDGAINRYRQGGLQVPVEVQAGSWWCGNYSSWFPALTGADVIPQASNTLTASMPEGETTIYPSQGDLPSIPVTCNTSENNGYSVSFTQWGTQNKYVPQSSGCCFAAGTGVLMADGSSRPIETVEIGDLILTDRGPRAVALKEQPPRGSRLLYRINGLNLRLTGGHPVRLAGATEPRYAAAEPWNLIDAMPTITAAGVTELKSGLRVNAIIEGILGVAEITSVEHDDSGYSPDTPVYDLIVEGWEQERTAYYTGGPDLFLAVEPESVDPTYSIAVTNGIVSIMDMVAPDSRKKLGNPYLELPVMLRRLDLRAAVRQCRQASRVFHGGKKLPTITQPGPDCTIQQGAWDPHASALEYYLALHLGRHIRSEAANGWRIAPEGQPNGDRLTLGLFDLELLDTPLSNTACVEVSLRTQQADATQPPVTLPVKTDGHQTWVLRFDRTLDLGSVPVDSGYAVIDGVIHNDTNTFARFRIAVDLNASYQNRHDVFLFRPDSSVAGRLALDLRRLSPNIIAQETNARDNWSPRQEVNCAICLGHQIGYQLQASIAALASI